MILLLEFPRKLIIKQEKSHKLIINLKASNDDGKVKNYTINTSSVPNIYTENTLTITQRNLNTVNIVVPEIPSSTPYTLSGVKFYDTTTNDELKLSSDVTFDTSAINGAGTYTVKVSPNSGNVTGETTATVRVADNIIKWRYICK